MPYTGVQFMCAVLVSPGLWNFDMYVSQPGEK